MSFEASETVTQEFFEYLLESNSLGHGSFHGKDHWIRVLQNAREIAGATGANLRVLELFAVLHDSRRENENHDPEHGTRAGDYANTLRGNWFEADDAEMALLLEACRYHSDGHTESDLTVQAYWDADRLDLGRVGVRPHARYMCTSYAKRPEVVEAAYVRPKGHQIISKRGVLGAKMRNCLVVALVAMSGGAALADAAFNPEFYRFLKDRGLEGQAFNYAVTWAGSSDREAETTVAYALLDGVGVDANPRAAIELACRSASMGDFDVGAILVQGNLRLSSKEFRPIRCQGND